MNLRRNFNVILGLVTIALISTFFTSAALAQDTGHTATISIPSIGVDALKSQTYKPGLLNPEMPPETRILDPFWRMLISSW